MKLGYLIYLISIGFSITTKDIYKDIYDNSWALVIGIDKYQNVKHLTMQLKMLRAFRRS